MFRGKKWKPITGTSGMYEVSNKGGVRSYTNWSKGKQLKPDRSNGKRGYVGYTLKYSDGILRSKYEHRLVAEAFLPNPENKPFVHHKDGNPSNNKVENLQWVTSTEHATIHVHVEGLRKRTKSVNRGEKNPSARLTNEKVIEIKKELCGPYYRKQTSDLAKKFNVSKDIIYKIRTGHKWEHVEVEGFTPFFSDKK